ncbi:cytochrome P450 4C1 [Cephus cinctus]|uniref:Cytochrome P450 4C1 n=1 Tax=Cephus cinctus TaxID=211228 RepID=A0AAJ7CB43_CEPCN|nr:cytochrome P450 4C1 [Cephus cinctus]
MLLYVVLSLLILIIILIVPYHLIVHKSGNGKLINKIPGPKAYPILGNLLAFVVPFEELWHVVRGMNEKYYPIYRIWRFSHSVINIRHPDDIEAIIANSKHIEKSLIYRFLQPWFGTGLLTSTGRKWQQRRRILTPAFHFNILTEYSKTFIEHAEGLVNSLKAEGEETVKDIVPLITTVTLSSICETAMGTPVQEDEDFQTKFQFAVHKMGAIVVSRVFHPWLFNDWLYKFTPTFRLQTKVLDILHGFSLKIINIRQQYHDATGGKYLNQFSTDKKNIDGNEVKDSQRKRLSMLDLLIGVSRNTGQIDLAGIREEVDTFIFEGHDTTSMAICFIIQLLAEHKDIQEKARKEIDEILKQNDGEVTITEIQQFAYLDRCIKESLRLYPSVPFMSRKLSEDLQLKNYLLPAGTSVHIHTFDLHRDPNFWPDPLVFDPDRFLPEKIQGRHPFCYLPFSGGPRNCIGQKFAMLELKAIIGLLLHNFYLEAIDRPSETRFLPDLILRPAHPIRVRFVTRRK